MKSGLGAFCLVSFFLLQNANANCFVSGQGTFCTGEKVFNGPTFSKPATILSIDSEKGTVVLKAVKSGQAFEKPISALQNVRAEIHGYRPGDAVFFKGPTKIIGGELLAVNIEKGTATVQAFKSSEVTERPISELHSTTVELQGFRVGDTIFLKASDDKSAQILGFNIQDGTVTVKANDRNGLISVEPVSNLHGAEEEVRGFREGDLVFVNGPTRIVSAEILKISPDGTATLEAIKSQQNFERPLSALHSTRAEIHGFVVGDAVFFKSADKVIGAALLAINVEKGTATVQAFKSSVVSEQPISDLHSSRADMHGFRVGDTVFFKGSNDKSAEILGINIQNGTATVKVNDRSGQISVEPLSNFHGAEEAVHGFRVGDIAFIKGPTTCREIFGR